MGWLTGGATTTTTTTATTTTATENYYSFLPEPKTELEFDDLEEKTYKEFVSLNTSSDWLAIEFEDPDGGDVKLYELMSDGPNRFYRTTGTIPVSVMDCYQFLGTTDYEEKKAGCKELLSIKVLEQISERAMVTYASYSSPLGVSNREFVGAKFDRMVENGTIISFATSINYSNCPTTPGNVRAVGTTAFIISPITESSCTLVRFSKVDPKGFIPNFIVNLAKRKIVLSFVLLRNVITHKVHSRTGSTPHRLKSPCLVVDQPNQLISD
jgi:hypothetical protein